MTAIAVRNFVIIFGVFSFALAGIMVIKSGMTWYDTIALPPWTPFSPLISAAWTTIFILTSISAILIWNHPTKDHHLRAITHLFILNGILNISWSILFFGLHLLGVAVIESVLLDLSILALIIFIRPRSPLAAILLIPYAAWVAFATYLSYAIWKLN